jgi:type IV secretion system protein VirD4
MQGGLRQGAERPKGLNAYSEPTKARTHSSFKNGGGDVAHPEQYTHDEAKAFTNIKTKIVFAAEDISDAEDINKLLGMSTIKITTGSSSTQSAGYSESTNYTYQAVPLLRPEEIMRFASNLSLVMRTGNAPVLTQQFIWYQQKFKNSRLPASFVPQHNP